MRNAGMMMVVAAGNSGPGCRTSDVPAIGDAAFSVGAAQVNNAPSVVDLFVEGVNRAELGVTITDFSSRGPAIDIDGTEIAKPDIVGPGFDVLSATPDGTYALFPGTSMLHPTSPVLSPSCGRLIRS